MKKLLSFFCVALACLFSLSCKSKPKDLIGSFDRIMLESQPYVEWYNAEINNYELDTVSLDSLDAGAFEQVEMLVYLGTWCSDSRREVPRFMKILDHLNVKQSKLNLTGLDREKSAPDYQENVWNIEFVPTMIFLKEGKEIGRIIETPEISLEK